MLRSFKIKWRMQQLKLRNRSQSLTAFLAHLLPITRQCGYGVKVKGSLTHQRMM